MSLRRMISMIFTTSVLLATTSACSVSSDNTEDFPDKSISIIVPFAAGGATDTNIRAIAEQAESTCNTDFVIRNIDGAAGATGFRKAAAERPDGYSIVAAIPDLYLTHAVGMSDVGLEDFDPIMRFGIDPEGIFANPDADLSDVDDVIKLAKTEKIRIANAGSGGSHHLAAAMFAHKAGISASSIDVFFEGDAAAVPAAARGETALVVTTGSGAYPYVKDNKLVPVATMGEERAKILPDVPTLNEQDIDYAQLGFWGFSAPAGTPKENIEYLERCFSEAADSSEFKDFMEKGKQGEVSILDHAEFDQFLKESSENAKEAVSKIDFSPEG